MAVRHYKVTLTTVGPVHIGNGNKYGKKDYFKIDDKGIGVLDAKEFVRQLGSRDLDEYCRFLYEDSRYNLQDFLDRHKNLSNLARKCVTYRVETPLATARRGSLQYFDIAQFVKDAHGCPYMPGSSVKGMLRTALLVYLIQKDRASYTPLYDTLLARSYRDRAKACRAIERKAFWKEKPDSHDDRVVNDIMHYVSVADSAPLSTDNLVFVKKYDKFARSDYGRHKLAMGRISQDPAYYEGNELNIYRECVKPGTQIEFTLDIDERIDAYLDGLVFDLDGVASVLEECFALYTRCFLDSFDLKGIVGVVGDSASVGDDDGICRYVIASGPLAGRRCRNKAVDGTGYCNTHKEYAVPAGKKVACLIGGGIDFDSKTVVNALLEKDPARVNEVSHILYAQFPTRLDPSIHSNLQDEVRDAGYEPKPMRAVYRRGRLARGKDDHRHWRDSEFGVSPHTVKLGIIGDKKYPMGRCSIEIKEMR